MKMNLSHFKSFANICCCTFFSLLLCASINTQAKIKDNIIIEGYVQNYIKLDKSVYLDKSISVQYYNAVGESKRITCNYDKQGKFKLSLYLLNIQDIIIQSGVGDYIQTLVKPGDELHMTVRYRKINQPHQHYPAIHYSTDFKDAFTGPNARRYNDFRSTYDKTQVLGLSNPDQSIGTDVNLLNNKLAKISAIVKAEFGTADATTAEWLKSIIACEHIYNYISQSQEKSLDVDYSKINFPKITAQNIRLFNIVKSIHVPQNIDVQYRRASVVNNPVIKLTAAEIAICDKAFAGQALGADSVKAHRIEDRFKANPKALESVDSIYCVLSSEYYTKNLPPLLAEFKNADMIAEYRLNSFFNQVRPKIFEGISPQLQAYIIAEVLTDAKFNKNISYTKSTDADLVKMLTTKFPGQNLYVDLWATWCAPCRAEFPYYPQVIEKYQGKVTFVFLCGASDEVAYKAVLNNLNFKANHFFLSKPQYANYMNTFGITGIPHYLFITKEGKITNNFKRPSAGNELYALIDAEIGK